MAKTTILYVDDEKDALQVVSMGLEERGYTILTAASGQEALDILEKQKPDLIIADLKMHPMNGFELYAEIKKDERINSIPFFFLTAVNEPLAQKYGQVLGVDAYITKPVDLDDLEDAIKNRLSYK